MDSISAGLHLIVLIPKYLSFNWGKMISTIIDTIFGKYFRVYIWRKSYSMLSKFQQKKSDSLMLEKWYNCIPSFCTRSSVWWKSYCKKVWPSRTISPLLVWEYDFTSRSKMLASFFSPSAPVTQKHCSRQWQAREPGTLFLQQFLTPRAEASLWYLAQSALPKFASRAKISY